MDALLRNIWVRMCCCCRLPANKMSTVNTGGSIQRLLKPNIITFHNSLQVRVKFSIRKKGFIYFIFYIYLKRMGLNLSTNLPMFIYTFPAMWRHRPLKEYKVFVGILAAHTFFSPFTLSPTRPRSRLNFFETTPSNQSRQSINNNNILSFYNMYY